MHAFLWSTSCSTGASGNLPNLHGLEHFFAIEIGPQGRWKGKSVVVWGRLGTTGFRFQVSGVTSHWSFRPAQASLFSADAHTLGFYGTFEGRVHFGIIPQPRRNNLFGGEQRQARIGPCVIHICRLPRQYRHPMLKKPGCVHCWDRRTIADNCGNLRLAAAFHPWRARESVRRRPESRVSRCAGVCTFEKCPSRGFSRPIWHVRKVETVLHFPFALRP